MFSALKPVSVITPTWETQNLALGQNLRTGEKPARESSTSTQLQFQPIIILLVFQLFSKNKENVVFLKQKHPYGMKTEQHMIFHKVKTQQYDTRFGGTMTAVFTFAWRTNNREICQHVQVCISLSKGDKLQKYVCSFKFLCRAKSWNRQFIHLNCFCLISACMISDRFVTSWNEWEHT